MEKVSVYVLDHLADALDKLDETLYNLAADNGCKSARESQEWCYHNAYELWNARDAVNAILNDWGYYEDD